MIVVFESIIPIFTIVILGFALRKSSVVPSAHWNVVEGLCFWLFFPALLAETLIKTNLNSIELGPFTLTLLATMASMILLTLALWPLLHRFWNTGPGQYSTIFQTTTRWHGFIALAIVLNLYGTGGAALVAVAMAVMVPILQVTNIFVLAAFSTSVRPSATTIANTILKNPIIWGVLTGLAVNFSQMTVWEPIVTTLDLLGRAALGASLLALGAGLSLQAALRPSRELLLGLVGKLGLTPLIMAAWGLFFGVRGIAFPVIMICAAVPTAMNGYVLAKKMGGDAELYAATSTIQTVVSFLSIPLILWLTSTFGF